MIKKYFEKSEQIHQITDRNPENKASVMMTDWFPYLLFLVCLVVTRRVYITWAWGESCHKTLVLLVFAQISIQFSSVLSLNAHGNPARLFPPSTPHQGGDLVGYQVKSSKRIFRTFLARKSILKFRAGLLAAVEGHLGWN